jgi:hypothetical protein
LHKLLVLFARPNLAIKHHLPNFLKEELRIVKEIFSELELIQMNESHCLVSALN